MRCEVSVLLLWAKKRKNSVWWLRSAVFDVWWLTFNVSTVVGASHGLWLVFLHPLLYFQAVQQQIVSRAFETKWLAGFSMSKWAIVGEANKARIQSKGLFETFMSSYLIFIRLCTVTQWKDLANCCTLTKVYSQLLYSFSWGIYKYKLNAS